MLKFSVAQLRSVGGDDAVQPCLSNWIEIELIDEMGVPCAGETFEIHFEGGTAIRSGRLDDNGLARVEELPVSVCSVTFPNLDKDAWEKF